MQPLRAHRNHLTRDQSGTSAVEFALVAPLFILMMLGMLGYGIYFGAAHSIQQLTADAARTAIAGLDEPERRSLAQAFIERNADGYAFVDREGGRGQQSRGHQRAERGDIAAPVPDRATWRPHLTALRRGSSTRA